MTEPLLLYPRVHSHGCDSEGMPEGTVVVPIPGPLPPLIV